jgi:OmpA-OmpF porin, OOP family
MNHRKFAGVCVVGALCASAAVHAEDSGFYLGAGLGEARQSVEGFDGSDTSFKVFGGYSFSRYLAAEAGYVDGGEQTDSQGSLDIAIKSDGYFIEGLAKIPLGKYVAPYVKLGYVVYNSTTKVSSGNLQASEYLHGRDLLYGAGIEFRFGDSVRVRTEYEDVDVSDTDFDIFSIVVAFQF